MRVRTKSKDVGTVENVEMEKDEVRSSMYYVCLMMSQTFAYHSYHAKIANMCNGWHNRLHGYACFSFEQNFGTSQQNSKMLKPSPRF